MYQLVRSLLILAFLRVVQSGISDVYYIKLNESDCQFAESEEQQCLTLSEFAASQINNVTITLILQPGNHSLLRNLSLSNIINFVMYSNDSDARIECESPSHFSFESVERVSIRKMAFIGCGNNLFTNVAELFIQETTFKGLVNTGTSLILMNTIAEIVQCTFVENQFGTIMESVESLTALRTYIRWLTVENFDVVQVGGAIISTHSNVSVTNSMFESNSADIGGDIYADKGSNISIYNSTFTGDDLVCDCEVPAFGGAIFSDHNNISVIESQFRYKKATIGASLLSYFSKFTINRSTSDSNSAIDHGGGLFAYRSTVIVVESTFHNNSALGGGGIATYEGEITISVSVFTFNRADHYGGALDLTADMTTISACYFEGNVAGSLGGALSIWWLTGQIFGKATQDCDDNCSDSYHGAIDMKCFSDSSLICKTQFISNSAPYGAALFVTGSNIKSCGPIVLSRNFATLDSSIYLDHSEWHLQGSIVLTQNLGSLFSYKSNISLSGCASFTNCSPPENSTVNFIEGGALTLYNTTLTVHGIARFVNNHAKFGGAIAATRSEVHLNGDSKVYVLNNSASVGGGGFYFSQSKLVSLLNRIVSDDTTENCGGLNNVSSLIKCIVSRSQYITDPNGTHIENYTGAMLHITENSAPKGGAIYMQTSSKIIILIGYSFVTHSAMNFIGNSAQYGGAIYIDDATNSGTCASNPFTEKASKSECFVSVVPILYNLTVNTSLSMDNILHFDLNIATTSGATLFGGLLDRCIANLNLTAYKGDGLQYLMDISSEQKIKSISSYPVQVCPCISNQQNCRYKINSNVKVKKGHFFTISLVAVDQVYRPVNATIEGHLHSLKSNLLNGQVTNLPHKCTEISFRIVSPHYFEELTLFARDGPCKDAGLSILKLNVTFLPCTCPIGFTPSDKLDNDSCLCVCHPMISPYVTECNSTTQSFRSVENVWISYFNSSNANSSGLLVHKYCPFDYCIPPNISGPINLNEPEGADAQCALNRTGLLCGACKPGLSLSLGSSKCLKCPRYWPVLFLLITVFSILAGFGLVILLLWLNITVAVGTLNGLLFYANIVAANQVILLPYPEPNLITVFISWLNLDLGIDVCYIEGMDIYTRTWLELAFPIYIIFLVALLIIISRYSSWFSNLIAKRNPVATLATLILISYGKLFHVVLLAQPLANIPLTYPDKTKHDVWLPDATYKYVGRKHIVLFLAALLILGFCIIYSFMLLCWQQILHILNWKMFKCIKIPNLILFMEAYHVPYTSRHRYWTGLLLLARAIIYIIATVNVSGSPQIQLISIIVVVSCVILLKMSIATNIFKKRLIDYLESFFYFNIIILASFTAYNLSTGNNQDGVAYMSVVLSMVVTLFILLYHVYVYSSFFDRLHNSKFVTHIIENWLTVKSKPESNKYSQPSIVNPIFRHDDTIDILMSDADRYSANTTRSTTTEQQQQTTQSVVEIF